MLLVGSTTAPPWCLSVGSDPTARLGEVGVYRGCQVQVVGGRWQVALWEAGVAPPMFSPTAAPGSWAWEWSSTHILTCTLRFSCRGLGRDTMAQRQELGGKFEVGKAEIST